MKLQSAALLVGLDRYKVDALNRDLRSADRVLDHQHDKVVGLVFVEAGEAVNGRQVRHIEGRPLSMSLHVHDAVVAELVFEGQVGHRATGEARGVLAHEVAKNLCEAVFDDGLNRVACGAGAFGGIR